MSFLRRLLGRDERPEADVFRRLRAQVFSVAPDALGLVPSPERPHVWAALMEWGVDDDVVMLVAIADGTVSLYLSSGGGVIGAGQHESVRRVANAFLDTAEAHRRLFAPAAGLPLPGRDRARFHLRTFEQELTAEADEQALAAGSHPLASLFHAAQDVIAAIRGLSPGDRPVYARIAPQGGPMTLVVAEPPGYEERAVAVDPDAETIERAVKGLAWSDITFVFLKVDDRNWIEGSGSLNPVDGLSAKFMDDGAEWVSSRPPTSLDEIISLLQSYRAGDGRWQKLIEWE
ncbi:MAG: hypothetical protein ABR499_07995 [Gemmatimonadaceae bacterium]